MTTSLTTEHYTHRGYRKDGEIVFMRESDVDNWNRAKKQGYGSVLIIRDLDGMISFHAMADLIEEVKAIDLKREQRVASEKMHREQYYRDSMINSTNKTEWTQNKLSEISKKEYAELVAKAKKLGHYKESIIRAYVGMMIRKKYNCPYK